MMDTEQRQHLKELQQTYRRRLHALQKQAASTGRDTRPEILLEIEDIQQQLSTLNAQLTPAPSSGRSTESTGSGGSPKQDTPTLIRENMFDDRTLGLPIAQGSWSLRVTIFIVVFAAIWACFELVPVLLKGSVVLSAWGVWRYIVFAIPAMILTTVAEYVKGYSSFAFHRIATATVGVIIGISITIIALTVFSSRTTLNSDIIPFEAPDNPKILNPALTWHSGNSTASRYSLVARPITINAGIDTNQWSRTSTAPFIIYPYSGDFIVQVKIEFNPSQIYQYAGVGVRSPNDDNTWIRISRARNKEGDVIAYDEAKQEGASADYAYGPYQDDIVYCKIERRGTQYSLSYSTDGTSWTLLRRTTFDLPNNNVEIFLTVFSVSNNQDATATFSDFIVQKQ